MPFGTHESKEAGAKSRRSIFHCVHFTTAEPFPALKRLELPSLLLSVILLCVNFFPLPAVASAILCGAAWIAAGWYSVLNAVMGLKNKQVEESLPVCVATILVFCLGRFAAAAFAMLVFQAGCFTLHEITSRKEKKLSRMLCPSPKNATLVDGRGNRIPALAERLQVGDTIEISGGERAPADCRVLSGEGEVDYYPLTGQKTLRAVKAGDTIYAGALVCGSSLVCEITATSADSAAAKIHEKLCHTAKDATAPLRAFRYAAAGFLPAVLLLAVAGAIFLPIFKEATWQEGLVCFATILAISCPTVLTAFLRISSLSTAAGGARRGVVFPSTKAICQFADADTLVIEPKAALTDRTVFVDAAHPAAGVEASYLVALATAAAQNWHQPIGKALRLYTDYPPQEEVDNAIYAENGVTARVGSRNVICGTPEYFAEIGCPLPPEGKMHDLALMQDNEYLGGFTLSVGVLPENLGIARVVHETGIQHSVLLTDFDEQQAKRLCDPCGIISYESGLTPDERAEKVAELENQGNRCIFVGSGKTDAAAHTAATVSVCAGDDLPDNAESITMAHRNLRLLAEAKQLAVYGVYTSRVFYGILLLSKVLLLFGALMGLPIWLTILIENLVVAAVLLLSDQNATRKIHFSDFLS